MTSRRGTSWSVPSTCSSPCCALRLDCSAETKRRRRMRRARSDATARVAYVSDDDLQKDTFLTRYKSLGAILGANPKALTVRLPEASSQNLQRKISMAV